MRLQASEPQARALLSLAPLTLAAAPLVDAAVGPGASIDRDQLIWTGLWTFVAWRFFRLGLYTSRWGVRICNPVLTWWYPWPRVEGFTRVQGEEAFLPKPTIIALVTITGRRRPIFALSTRAMFFRLSPDRQAEILADLNRRASERRG